MPAPAADRARPGSSRAGDDSRQQSVCTHAGRATLACSRPATCAAGTTYKQRMDLRDGLAALLLYHQVLCAEGELGSWGCRQVRPQSQSVIFVHNKGRAPLRFALVFP